LKLVGLPHFPDYELIDSGDYRKLERFGRFVVSRPEPQAIWSPALGEAEWARQAQAIFERRNTSPVQSDEGNWTLKPGMPEQWFIGYDYGGMHLQFRLGLTSFKHLGIFPEQAANWNYLYDAIRTIPIESPRALNLFAYTGGASLAAQAAGADVVHVDAVKPVITWARQNMEASGLENIRWAVEDALKFAKKEARRGRTFHAIILDPPAYGRGPEGEKWLLEKHLNELLGLCRELLDSHHGVFLLNLYSMGFSPLVADNLVRQHFPQVALPEFGELFVPDRRGARLPLGSFVRFTHSV
jgi:23S rRNA (cytosine1962-C5)-methyltransferase